MADKVDVLDLLDRAQSAMDYTQAAREAAQSCGVLPGDFRHLRTAIAELIAAAKRANGDHHAPDDCYATGPLTGDPFRDLVECPGCVLAATLASLAGAAP